MAAGADCSVPYVGGDGQHLAHRARGGDVCADIKYATCTDGYWRRGLTRRGCVVEGVGEQCSGDGQRGRLERARIADIDGCYVECLSLEKGHRITARTRRGVSEGRDVCLGGGASGRRAAGPSYASPIRGRIPVCARAGTPGKCPHCYLPLIA